MKKRLFPGASFILGIIALGAAAQGASPESSPIVEGTPKLPQPTHLAPFQERMNAAKSVKVKISLLGVTLNSSLESAHEKLDALCDARHQPKKEEEESGEEGEEGQKMLWELAKTDYSSIYVKTDDKERITYILGHLRPGKEVPFKDIGEVAKAPIQTDTTVAWDVIRTKGTLIRVVAQGAAGKASSITIFFVKRRTRA